MFFSSIVYIYLLPFLSVSSNSLNVYDVVFSPSFVLTTCSFTNSFLDPCIFLHSCNVISFLSFPPCHFLVAVIFVLGELYVFVIVSPSSDIVLL